MANAGGNKGMGKIELISPARLGPSITGTYALILSVSLIWDTGVLLTVLIAFFVPSIIICLSVIPLYYQYKFFLKKSEKQP